MKKTRRFLSAALAAAVFGSASAVVAVADTATQVSNFADLQTAIANSATNIELTGTITVTADINLTGVTLTAKSGGTFDGSIIKTSGTVEITGGTINGNGLDQYVVNVTGGSATLDGVTVTNQTLTGDWGSVTKHSTIRNNGSLTLTDCTVKAGDPAGVKNEEQTTLTVSGGSITGNKIGITNFGSTTLDDGASVKAPTAIYALTYDTYPSTTTINDAAVEGKIVYGGYGEAGNGGRATQTPTVVINDGADLTKSGLEEATNATMAKLPQDAEGNNEKPTLQIDPEIDPDMLGDILDDAEAAGIQIKTPNGTTSNYLTLKMAGGSADIEFEDAVDNSEVKYPNVSNNGRFAIPVGSAASITINRPGYTVSGVKVGNAATKRDATKEADGEYSFTVEAGDTEIEVQFANTTPPKPTTTTTKPSANNTNANNTNTNSTTNPTKNPSTGIALAAAPAILAAGAVIVASKKRK